MMIRIFVLSLLISGNLFAGDHNQDKPGKGTLTINFIGLKNNDGNVKVALANSAQNYKDHKNPFIGKTVPIKNNKAVIVLEDVPFGEYAVKAFHDEDANDKLNTNFFGMPIEDYGFSNDARGTFGPPSWKDAKFIFDEDKLSLTVIIR